MTLFNWTLLKSKHMIKDKWLSLRADTCRIPSGQIVEPYYVFEYPAWVNVVALTSDNEIVLVRQYRHGLQQTLLELPSGGMEKTDLSPLAAAKRELSEETGYSSEDFIPLGRLSVNPASHTNLTHSFLAANVVKTSSPNLDRGEQLETVLVPLDRIFDLIERNEFIQSLHAGAILLALRRLGRITL